MKKRIISVTLALSMVIALLAGMTISASAKKIGVEVAGVEINKDKEYKSSDFPTGVLEGSITYNPTENKLTLNNAKIISGSNTGIVFNLTDKAGTIELIGNNTITTNTDCNGIKSSKAGSNTQTLNIKSASGNQGSLEIKSNGIDSANNISIENCTLTTEINGTAGTAFSLKDANLSISSSTVAGTSPDKGIYVNGGNMTISGSTVTSTGADFGICVGNGEKNIGTLNISNSTVTATSTKNSGNDFGICSFKDITISNSTVNAAGSYGIYSIAGDITAQSGKITAKSNYTNGVAVLAGRLKDQPAGGNINLGKGLYIKTGGNIRNNINEGEYIVSTIAEGTVTYNESDGITGAAKYVEICIREGTVSVLPPKLSNISSVTLPSDKDLINAVLTKDDSEAIKNGTDISIQMEIKSVQAPADADKVQQKLGKNTLGMYLDISIFKTVGETKTAVQYKLNPPIRITFTIPENLRGKDKYYVIRVHDDETIILEDLDNDPNTVTFETDRFSTYALVYSTPAAKSAKTSDNSNITALAVMAASSLAAIAYIEKKKF